MRVLGSVRLVGVLNVRTGMTVNLHFFVQSVSVDKVTLS
jgi:hypothetical protein